MSRIAPGDKAIDEAAALLRAGQLVAFPTETVYGLGALALDPIALGRIFAMKGRPPTHPLILHVDGEAMAVFSHGRVVELAGDELAAVDEHWTAHYGSSPQTWGDVVMWRLDPSWMVGYAWHREELLAERGVET